MVGGEWETGHSFQSVCEFLKERHDRPGAIKRACAVVEECLISNKDNLRGFFEHCFPLLLKRIFGYDDKEASWLHIVAVDARDDDATALIQLLAPSGPLFTALHAADGDQLIQFLFPPERLPAHTQELLRVPAGRVELDGWPQYHGRLRLDGAGRCQVHLNTFSYFVFWAAFYVLRGGRSGDKGGKGGSTTSRGRALLPPGARKLWGSGASDLPDSIVSGRHPYFRLLRLYLEAYLPRPAPINPLGPARPAGGALGGGAGRGGAGGALASCSALVAGLGSGATAAFPGSLLGSTAPGEVLLSVLLEFWLTDAGEPLPPEPAATAAAPASRAGSPTGQLVPGGTVIGVGPGAVAAGAVGAWGGGAGLGVVAPGGQLGLAGAAGLGVVGEGVGVQPGAGLMPGPVAMGAQAAAGLGGLAGGGYGVGGVAGGASVLGLSGAPGLGSAAAIGGGMLPAGAGGGTLHTYSYQPPAEELVQALSLLVRYVFVAEPPAPDAPPAPAQAGSKWLPVSPVATLPLPSGRLALPHHASPLMASPAFSPAAQAVSRKLYRLLRRTFAQWQPSSSASLGPIVKLWLVVLCPWKAASYNDTVSLAATLDALAAGRAGARGGRRAAPGGTLGGGGGLVGGAAGVASAALRGAAEDAARLLGAGGELLRSAGGGSSGGGGGGGGGVTSPGGHSLLSGAGHVAASASATLNRWGSEMAHHLSGAAVGLQGNGLDQPGEARGASSQSQQYTPAWRSHVLAHLPFYTQLLPAFLELAYSQMAYSARPALKEAYRVMKSLAESGPGLVQELRQAEAAFNRYVGSSMRRPEGELAELLPWLVDQATDWEAAAAAGAPTTPPLVPDARYRAFTLEQGGAASCMRALLAAADRQNLHGRERVRSAAELVLPLSGLPSEEVALPADTAAARDLPKAGCWRDVHYHGDWMLRPIASNEVALLVRLLVGVSFAINRALGLTGTPTPPGEEPPETVVQELLGVARRRGWRLNLRPLAELQTLAWLVGLVILGRWLWALASSPGGLFGLDDQYYAELAAAQAAAAAAPQRAAPAWDGAAQAPPGPQQQWLQEGAL